MHQDKPLIISLMESNRKGAQTCPSLVRESEGTRLVRVTNMPATDSQRPADAISPSAIPLATDPSFHTSSLLFLTTQEGGVMERSHSQHRTTFYCLPCTDTNVCRRVYHPSLPGNKRNHAKYSVVCISRCFSLFPFCSHFNHAVSQTWGLWDFHCFHMKQTGGLFFIFYFLNVVVKRDCIVQKNNNNHNKKKACTCKSRHAHTP